jgi:iron complex outermembrane recepter protein
VVTYLANARYHLNDNSTGYARFATGYRPGGPNFTLKDPTTGLPVGPPMFGPDKLRSYELGIKARSPDRAYSLDAAGYYINWKDIRFAVAEGKFSGIENAGNAKIRGAELALTGRPVNELTAQAAFAYQDARLSEAVPALGGTDGERLPNVPRFTASLNADYLFSAASLLPTLGFTVRYVTDRMASFDNSLLNAQYRLPAYTTADLRGGLTLSSVEVQLYVHNLFDERGELSSFGAYSALGETKVAILQPRTVGIALTTHF